MSRKTGMQANSFRSLFWAYCPILGHGLPVVTSPVVRHRLLKSGLPVIAAPGVLWMRPD
jgi:hypothetical protein